MRYRMLRETENKLDQKWEEKFELLEMFIDEFDRFPKAAERYKGVRLGAWCINQKKCMDDPYYPQDRMTKLKQIGLLDTTRSALWDKHFELLKKFIAEYNRFPKKGERYCDFNIGNWCSEQKQKALRPDYNSYRMEKLQEIGLLDNSAKLLAWEDAYKLLREYITEYHKFPVGKELYKGYNLGNWCEGQKFLSKNPDYPADHLQKLQEIGLFSTTQDAKWERNYLLLLDFIQEYGRLPKQKESYRGERIGIWCTAQKKRCTSEEKIEKLKQVGLLENTQGMKWEEHYQQLEEFVNEYHRFPKKIEKYHDINIGHWCAEQKRKIENDKYSSYRAKKLREIGFLDQTVKQMNWEEYYQLLQEYVAKYNQFPTEDDLYKGSELGNWYQSQIKQSEIPEYPIEQLQKLQEVVLFCTPKDAKWEQNYQLLQEFVNEYHRFPKTNEKYQDINIGNWCAEQKKSARKGTYASYRIEKLIEIGLLKNGAK